MWWATGSTTDVIPKPSRISPISHLGDLLYLCSRCICDVSCTHARQLLQNIKKVFRIDNSSYRLIFYLDKIRKTKYIIIAQKSILKLVKLQSLVAKCCKIRKI
jgi:hypothetical protein